MAHPAEGRAPHARKGGIAPTLILPPFGHPPLAPHPAGMECFGIRKALPRGRGDRVPPRKSPFASSPGLPRKAIPARLGLPAEGRAPHAREGRHWLDRGMAPLGPGALVNACGGNGMLGIRTAVPCGRGDRAPPRKSPFASSPGLPRKAIPARLGLPTEGRALHAPSETSPPNALLKEPFECLFPNHTRTNSEPTMKAFFGIDQLPKCGIGRLAH